MNTSKGSAGQEPTTELPTTGLEPYRTKDGSFTLREPSSGVFYHSVHGAVLESHHVFIQAGLAQRRNDPVRVLEVGLGTGLNLLLTWIRCLEGKCTVEYTALEPHPIDIELLERLRYCDDLGWPGLHQAFIKVMTNNSSGWQDLEGGLRFRVSNGTVQQSNECNEFDVVFFDAFGPRTHPDMWTDDVLRRMYMALTEEGLLVTYCAKGKVRRTMMDVGFSVERLPGPPGKREMLRATKPRRS